MRYLRQQRHWAEIRNPRAWLARTAWRVALDRRRQLVPVSLEDVAEVVELPRGGGERGAGGRPRPDAGAC